MFHNNNESSLLKTILIGDHKIFFRRLIEKLMKADGKDVLDGVLHLREVIWLANVIAGTVLVHFIDRFFAAGC